MNNAIREILIQATVQYINEVTNNLFQKISADTFQKIATDIQPNVQSVLKNVMQEKGVTIDDNKLNEIMQEVLKRLQQKPAQQDNTTNPNSLLL